jgi:ATP phosphoribosyltransferase regulatory subunit HisZ
MIFEHEIPAGSRLYFGASARIKREIESIAAAYLVDAGYEEIVTPLFSYHQHESFADRRPLIRLNDAANHEVSLRADSTADVVRLITRRLGRSSGAKKWFYIQPVFSFPTHEQYQVGAEVIDGDFVEVMRTAMELMHRLQLAPLIQMANMAIPQLLIERYGIASADIEAMRIEAILASGYDWIESLVRIQSPADLRDLSVYPDDLARELARIADAVARLGRDDVVVSPLYYARLRYYDALIFRMIDGNALLATGGTYRIDTVAASGFALYTDACIAHRLQKDTHGQSS